MMTHESTLFYSSLALYTTQDALHNTQTPWLPSALPCSLTASILSGTGSRVESTPLAICEQADKVSAASKSGSLSSCRSLLYVDGVPLTDTSNPTSCPAYVDIRVCICETKYLYPEQSRGRHKRACVRAKRERVAWQLVVAVFTVRGSD